MHCSPLYPLSPACEEVIFAPFHDPLIAPTLNVELKNISASHCAVKYLWCYTNLTWVAENTGTEAAEFIIRTAVDISLYDKVILCLSVPVNISFTIATCVDSHWNTLPTNYAGKGEREEILADVSGQQLDSIKIKFTSSVIGQNVIRLSWFGLQNAELVEKIATTQKSFSWNWENLIRSPDEWSEIKFEKELLFSVDDLALLRQKKKLPYWDVQYKILEEAADKYMARIPENDLGEYLPLDDSRYMRAHETGKTPYHWEALVLGFVGLLSSNKEMMYHALRYLCCMLHTRHWVQSAESKLSGSTWDQRCFMEEMTTTSVVILADWYAFAVTPQAKQLIRQSIWDKGLATIERDMMKFEYLYQCNQGLGFSRARILGGLYLQDDWPRMGNYVERAYTDMVKILDNYVHADGGVDEGPGYFCQAFQGALPGIIAYQRSKRHDFRKFLRKKFKKTVNYVSALASTVPGKLIPVGDCRTDYFCGDVIPIMASVFTGSAYDKILKSCIENGSIFSVTGLMANSGGILGFIHGPDSVRKAECIVPEFIQLPLTGIISSYRQKGKHSVRTLMLGSQPRPWHAHPDKGSIVVEIDSIPVLVDRGMVSYTSTETVNLSRSSSHNLLTPVLDNEDFPEQDIPSKPVIPKGRGSNLRFSSSIKLHNVWHTHMNSYTRSMESSSLEKFCVNDAGELKEKKALAFHLHSSYPFKKSLNSIVVRTENFVLHILADWAKEVVCGQKSINLQADPVYSLALYSEKLLTFDFVTNFYIEYHN